MKLLAQLLNVIELLSIKMAVFKYLTRKIILWVNMKKFINILLLCKSLSVNDLGVLTTDLQRYRFAKWLWQSF
jgi:hypothetical protein